MKLALRYIPTEVWVDVICYPWISRKKLGKIVHKFRNRYFAEILQYCLHERGKQTLGTLDLREDEILPQTPMPENIRFFETIRIWHFDSPTLDFLRRISGLFVNNGVNLDFDYFSSPDELAKLRTVLDHLSLLFHGIHSLTFDHRAIPLVERYFGPKLAQVKMISMDLDPVDDEPFDPPATAQAINFCMNWLISEDRNRTEPKFLEVYFHSEVCQQFSMAVQQQFQLAKRPSTFEIKIFGYRETDFQLDVKNNSIGEQLHGKFDEYGDFWIFRHQADSTRTKLEEWVEEAVGKRNKSSRIEFFPTLTIGQINANVGEDEGNDAEKEADHPSTSKKPKLT